jgi:hypothetical protein
MGSVIILVVLGVAAAVLIWKFKHIFDWHDGVLDNVETTFDLGETRTVTYRAVAKRTRVLDPLEVAVSVRCEEEVYYQQGSDRVRKTNDWYVGHVAVSRQPDDLAVALVFDVHIPDYLAPSMDLRNNNINWTIDINLDPANGIQLSESHDIAVGPRVRTAGVEPTNVYRRLDDDGSGPLPPTPGGFYE